jgi:hypothetical protein
MNGAARAGFMKLDENGKRIYTGVDRAEGYAARGFDPAVSRPAVCDSPVNLARRPASH